MKSTGSTKLLAVTWLFIGICTLFSSPAYAAWAGNIVDTFDGASINTRLWRPFEESPHQRLSQQGGELRIQIDGGSHGGAGVRSKFSLMGDFDMTVDYRLIAWPEPNGVKLGFEGPGGESSDQVIIVNRVSWGPDDPQNPKEVYFASFQDGAGGSGGQVPTADDHGTLKLSRVGSLLTGYFFNQATSQWQQIASYDYSATGFKEGVEITLWASASGSTAPIGQDSEIAFDNFQVSYDQVRFNSDLSPLNLLLLE
jgi:hypothetical protein